MSEGRANPNPLIWIVDDSPVERQISESSLGAPFEFVHFADGSEMVERLAAGVSQPDLVLLDWVMPGMTGDEVCRFIRSQEATRDLPVILVTASRVETEDVVNGLASGANDYVARPFAPEELRARVEAALRVKRLADAARRERIRVETVNRLGRALFAAGTDIPKILDELANTLTAELCDGCSILLLPGDYPESSVVRHRADPTGAELAAISSVADPTVFAFDSDEHALATLPPAYHPYIRRFGLRGLGILPFPTLAPIQGVVTVSRERDGVSFAADDLAAITTCIEYASLAVQNALRFDAERLARAQLDAVFAQAPFGIVVAGTSGAIQLANPAAARLVPGIVRAADLAAVFALAPWRTADGAPLDEAEWAARWHQHGGAAAIDLVVGRREGDRTLSVTTVAISNGDDPLGTVTTIEDVTAARQIAAERERVAAFQQQMLGIVSHDLRNPLGAITAAIDVVEIRAASVPAVAAMTKRMRASSGRMLALIDQLLDVTRARLGGGIPVSPRDASLRQITRLVLDELALARSKVEVELADGDEVEGFWDPDRLAQVVSNLVNNAIQYGAPGRRILIEITGDDAEATLAVSNAIAGEPIPADRLKTIFDPYARGGDVARHTDGLGLGLYIVSEIVRAHHGTIEASSTPDGTTFRVVLPRRTRVAR